MILSVSSDGTIIPIAFKTLANAKAWIKSKDYDVTDYSFTQIKEDPINTSKVAAKKKSLIQKEKEKKDAILEKRKKYCADRLRKGLPVPKSCGGIQNYTNAKVSGKVKPKVKGKGKGKKGPKSKCCGGIKSKGKPKAKVAKKAK